MAIDRSLITALRAACGDEHVLTERHALRTYESDGLLQYAVVPRAAVLPGSAGGGGRGRARLPRPRRAVGRARRPAAACPAARCRSRTAC